MVEEGHSPGNLSRPDRRRAARRRPQPADAAAGAPGDDHRTPRVSRLTFGAGLFPTDPLPAMVSLAKVSESLGFTHAWVGDSHLIWREAYVTLAAAAVGTSRLVLGTGVTNVLTRDPSVVASTFSTLQEAFPRRLILGLGLGDSAVETMGKKPARLADFELAVRRMRDLLNGRDVAIDTGTIQDRKSTRLNSSHS